jgi:antitoxin component of RelBE/YafQ-DinJ toxin-antitoxin module
MYCIMSNAALTIRTDSDTKKAIADFAASLGLSTSAFITAVTLQAMRERRVVLTPSLEPTPYLTKIIKEAERDYKAGKNITLTTNHAELEAYLHSL